MSYTSQIYKPKLSVYLDGYGSTFDNDILSISPTKQSYRAWTGEFDIGNITIELKDPNYLHWGTFSPSCLNIYNPIGKKVYINSDGTRRFSQVCRDITHEDGVTCLICSDILEDLKTCRFQYDYKGVNDSWIYDIGIPPGWAYTVSINGTQLIINDFSQDKFEEFFATYSITSNRDYAYDTSLNRKIIFLPYAPDYNESPIDWMAKYKEAESSIISNIDYNSSNKRMTADLTTVPTKPKHFVYIRKNIKFTGNPVDVIDFILFEHHSNTNYPYVDKDLAAIYYWDRTSATNAEKAVQYYHFNPNYEHVIISEEEGTPLEEVKNILQSSLIDMFVDENGRINLVKRRNRSYVDETPISIYYNSDFITPKLSIKTDESYNRFKVKYGYNEFGAGDKYTKSQELKATSVVLTGTNEFLIESKWMQRDDEAKDILELLNKRYGKFTTKLPAKFGPNYENLKLGSICEIGSFHSPVTSIHPLNSGSYFEIVELKKTLGNYVNAELEDISSFLIYKGFGSWEDADTLDHSISGTSIFGLGTWRIEGTDWTDNVSGYGTVKAIIEGCQRTGTFLEGYIGENDTVLVMRTNGFQARWIGKEFTWSEDINEEIFRIDAIYWYGGTWSSCYVTRGINGVATTLDNPTIFATMQNWQLAATCLNINTSKFGTTFRWE